MSLICKILGHKYQARHSVHYSEPTVTPKKSVGLQDPETYIRMLDAAKERQEIYMCDVCTRCGDVIKTIDEPLELSELSGSGGKHKRNPLETVCPTKYT